MEAMQTNREGSRKSIIGMVALAVAAVIGLDVRSASACKNIGTGSTTVTPAGGSVSASSSNVSLGLSGVTVTFSSSSASGTIPVSPSNHNDAGSVCIEPLTGISFSGGKSSIGGTVSTAVTGNWWLILQNDDTNGDKVALWIPKGGLTVKVNVLGVTCTATNSQDVDLSGKINSTTQFQFSNVSVPVTSSGGFPCPSGTTATFSGTFNTNTAITVAP